MQLRTQIYIVFLAISITTIAVASFFHYRTAREARLQEVYNHMESLSEAKKLRMQGIVSKRKEQIILLQIRELLRENFRDCQKSKSSARRVALSNSLKFTRDKVPSIREVHLLSMQGIVEVSSSPTYSGMNFSMRESFRHALEGELCTHDFYYDQNGTLSLNTAGLLTLEGENIGVVVIKTSAEDILSLINDYTGLGESGETTLAKKLGKKIFYLTPTRFHPDTRDSVLIENRASFAMAHALAGKEELLPLTLDYRNQTVVASTRFLEDSGWGLITKIDRTEALAPLRNILYQTLLLALVLVAAVAVAAHFFARRIIQPVLTLRDTTLEIAKGNLNKRIRYNSRNEVGQLAFNFNLMVDQVVVSQKMLERKIEQMDRINDSLNRFAYVVSHDLKSPLHSLSALIRLLQQQLANHEDPNLQRMLLLAEGKAKHMVDLIAGILHYSMSGNMVVERGPVSLNLLVEEVVQQLEVPKHISIEVEELPVVLIERIPVMQVFQNLIHNAVKYIDKPLGQIKIGCSKAEDGYIGFFVSDNGRGIASRNLEKVFDIFNKVHRVPGIDSSGVGLSIVKKIIESKGGRVWVESEIGAGSTFFVTLPKEDV